MSTTADFYSEQFVKILNVVIFISFGLSEK